MQSNKIYTPFVRSKDSTSKVMSDVMLALLPCILISYFAFGFIPIMVILVAVGSAVLAEFFFSLIFSGKTDSISDGSAIVTGILLAFTIAPFTPVYVVAFGGAMAVIFGKLLWGGLGRNTFNPALVGREFMTIFFPLVMTSRTIWYDKTAVNLKEINLFNSEFWNELFFKPSGAIGEYSILLLVLGGVYLICRRRISWHIPFALCASFFVLLMCFLGNDIQFSLGGVLLAAIFMATDMPSSASTNSGKLYYGAMIGAVAMICILNGVRYEYMSYSVLLMNAFVQPINWAFRPREWGAKLDVVKRATSVLMTTAGVVITTFAIIYLHQLEAIKYLVFIYIAFCVLRFITLDTLRLKREKAK